MKTSFVSASPRAPHVLAALAAIAAIAVPLAARASIEVAPPTGDVDPALCAELQRSVTDVAAGASATYGVDGSLEIAAAAAGEEIAVSVELLPADGEPVRRSATVPRAELVPTARRLAREAIRAAAEGGAAPPAVPGAEGGGSASASMGQGAERSYDMRVAFVLSGLPTALGLGLSGAFIALFAEGGAFGGSDYQQDSLILRGIVLETLSGFLFVSGPALGHFYAGNRRYAWLSYGGKLLLAGGAAGAFSGSWFHQYDQAAFGACIALGATFSAALLALVVADFATLPRAVRRANGEEAKAPDSEKPISAVAVAPMLAPGPRGSTTTGLAFSMRF